MTGVHHSTGPLPHFFFPMPLSQMQVKDALHYYLLSVQIARQTASSRRAQATSVLALTTGVVPGIRERLTFAGWMDQRTQAGSPSPGTVHTCLHLHCAPAATEYLVHLCAEQWLPADVALNPNSKVLWVLVL